jgi:hypothetical protein
MRSAVEGWSRNPNGKGSSSGFTSNGIKYGGNVDAYYTLNTGAGAIVLEQLTGATTCQNALTQTQLVHDFNSHDPIIMGTLSSFTGSNHNGFVTYQVYYLTAIDQARGKFTFVNPADDSKLYPSDGARTVTVTWAQLMKSMHDISLVTMP